MIMLIRKSQTWCLDGCVDVRELARLFVYDPRACEKFVKKVIDTGMDLSTVLYSKRFVLRITLRVKRRQKVDKPF